LTVPILGPQILEAPRAVIFDIGRVIIRVDLARAFEALAGRKGLSHEQVFRELQADSHWQDWLEGRMMPQDWHKHISGKFHLSVGFDDFCRIWNSVLDPVTILPELLFERLAASCRLALISNTDPIHVAHIEATFPFVRHFPVRVYSCHVGASKPALAIYHHAVRELGALPEETMFIDDVRENAVAAASLGITAFHFTSADELLDEFSRLGLWEY
jgi:FMN phosphatase YigB (HAD superfamily)